MDDDFIEFDELENAIDNLEMAAHFLKLADAGKRWKWTIIALHQALYGFAVSAIRGTDGRHLVDQKRDRLISIWEALDRAKNPLWMPWSHSIPLTTTPDEDRAIRRLVEEFRNGFEHFRPQLWLIEVSGLPVLLHHVSRVILFLALDSNCITYVDRKQEPRIRAAFTSIAQALEELKGLKL